MSIMGLWEGVAMDSLKFHLDQLCPTLLRPAVPFYALTYPSTPCPTLLRPALPFYALPYPSTPWPTLLRPALPFYALPYPSIHCGRLLQ
jgi:hypothetical protein